MRLEGEYNLGPEWESLGWLKMGGSNRSRRRRRCRQRWGRDGSIKSSRRCGKRIGLRMRAGTGSTVGPGERETLSSTIDGASRATWMSTLTCEVRPSFGSVIALLTQFLPQIYLFHLLPLPTSPFHRPLALYLFLWGEVRDRLLKSTNSACGPSLSVTTATTPPAPSPSPYLSNKRPWNQGIGSLCLGSIFRSDTLVISP